MDWRCSGCRSSGASPITSAGAWMDCVAAAAPAMFGSVLVTPSGAAGMTGSLNPDEFG